MSPTASVFALLIMIARVSLVASQLVSLTVNRDEDIMITCPGEEVQYICTAEGQLGRVQWLAEPYVTPNNISRVVENNANNVGSTATIGDIVIQYVSNDPFITTLTINATTATVSTNVSCSTIGLSSNVALSQPYRVDVGPVEPVKNLTVERIDDGDISSGFDFVVLFNSSSSLDIDRHVITCTDGNCEDIPTESSGATGRCLVNTVCNVSVRAINRCGRESSSLSQTIQGPVKIPSNFQLKETVFSDNPAKAEILGVFISSPSPNISQYIVNCANTSAICNSAVINGTENSFTLEVKSSCTGKTYNMSIVAMDISKRRSRAVFQSVKVKESSAYCALLVVFPFTAVFFIAALVVIGVLVAYIQMLKKLKADEKDTIHLKAQDAKSEENIV